MNDPTHPAPRDDDELLSAYLDGELPEREADALTERLAREPALAARLADLGNADEATRALYRKLDEIPLPQGVLDTLEQAGRRARKDTATVIPFPQRFIASFWQAPVALAASVALVAGFLVSRVVDTGPPAVQGMSALAAASIPADSDVHALLDESASGTEVTLGDGSKGRVVLTFASTNGTWCRQLALTGATQQVDGVACRRDGRWHTEVLSFAEPAGGGYQPASGGGSAVASAVDNLIGESQPLDSNEESRLIETDWKKN